MLKIFASILMQIDRDLSAEIGGDKLFDSIVKISNYAKNLENL